MPVEARRAIAGGRYRHRNDTHIAPIDRHFGGCARVGDGAEFPPGREIAGRRFAAELGYQLDALFEHILFLGGGHYDRVLMAVAVHADFMAGRGHPSICSGNVSIEWPGMNQVVLMPKRRKSSTSRGAPKRRASDCPDTHVSKSGSDWIVDRHAGSDAGKDRDRPGS
jgi:hypothetical protein